jgi:hypothetical protein
MHRLSGWDGLGRPVGRLQRAKSPVFTGLGTTGRVYKGEGVPQSSQIKPSQGELR